MNKTVKFSENMLAFYIVTCPAVYLELFISWGFLSQIPFLALFVLMRSFFGDAVVPGGGGGVLPEKLGRGVRPASENPYPIYDQNLRYSLP